MSKRIRVCRKIVWLKNVQVDKWTGYFDDVSFFYIRMYDGTYELVSEFAVDDEFIHRVKTLYSAKRLAMKLLKEWLGFHSKKLGV